jgi:hypothetical protein
MALFCSHDSLKIMHNFGPTLNQSRILSQQSLEFLLAMGSLQPINFTSRIFLAFDVKKLGNKASQRFGAWPSTPTPQMESPPRHDDASSGYHPCTASRNEEPGSGSFLGHNNVNASVEDESFPTTHSK